MTGTGPGLVPDVTAILEVLRSTGSAAPGSPPYGAETAVGLVYPSLADAASGGADLSGVSLLWGAPLFRRRVSRAVVALDGDMWARIARGGAASHVLAWAAVAHGILGRNKGLRPAALSAAGLDRPGDRARFEHASALGPRPAKTKRGWVAEHMRRVYGLLGEPYVLLASELALLLEDAGPRRVCRWLELECEHQDARLAALIPAAHDAAAIYRLHYVAMLASLNFGVGEYLRPEILVLQYLGPRISAESARSSLEKFSDRLEAERRANPGCEEWLQSITQ